MIPIKRALLSCHDKTGLDVLGKSLAEAGVELVASGGTAEFLKKHGAAIKTVEEFAGIAEQLDGRVKTLHPKIHAGILARRDDAAHVKSVGSAGLIDLVIVNLYPFEETIGQPGVSLAQAIEQIDIGGVALLRAAAKNAAHVVALSNPSQYLPLIGALRKGKGSVPPELAMMLAAQAFRLTCRYDEAIAAYLEAQAGATSPARTPPQEREVVAVVRRRQPLRYGENPHQRGTWYVPDTSIAWGLGTLSQIQGKELSYNNLLDVDAAVRCLLDCPDPSCVIIKHNSLCGLAASSSVTDAYERAHACDAESAFGGIVGFNRPVDAAVAERLAATFLEVIVAPSVDRDALALLAKKPNLRVVTIEWPAKTPPAPEWRQLLGSWVMQDPDAVTLAPATLKTATRRAPTPQEQVALAFAWTAAKHVKSNGVVLARDRATVGIGQGQPSRVGSVRLALEKAGERARGAVAASDGFFPFPDSVELLAQAGVTAIMQPGGSLRDAEVIAAADAAGAAMCLTGVRHFRH